MGTGVYSAADIKRVRLANDMTQAEFAEYMAVARRTVIRWERTGVHWKSYGFECSQFEKLEQPQLPL